MSAPSVQIILLAFVVVGCAEAHFPEVANVSEVQPGERVVIGQIVYADGDITKWVSGTFEKSWPYFSYDLDMLYGPRRRIDASLFGPRGGVFAIRVKPGTAYLYSIAVVTRSFFKPETEWTFPVMLELPPSNARCTYAGTIVLSISGDSPTGVPWYAFPGYEKASGSRAKAKVSDTYDRDRAVLSGYVKGCELERALAVTPPREEVDRLLSAAAKARAQEKADNDALVSP